MLMFNYDQITDIELELSTYCNAACQLCYRNYTSFKEHYPINKFRELNDIINQLNLFKNLTHIKLVGTISEPTLYKDFLKLIDYINERDLIIEICTNGDTRDDKFWIELGQKLKEKDSIYFTICGSTQELHEIYRTKTSLKNILKNAKLLRTAGKKNDYAQCIRFSYNDDDFESDKFKELISEFSNIYMTETYLRKSDDNYVNKSNLHLLMPHSDNIKKMITAEKLANAFFKKSKANCKAQNWKRVQVDINGNIYPCYLFLEASKGTLWDNNWESINNLKYDCCKFCEKTVQQYCLSNNISSII